MNQRKAGIFLSYLNTLLHAIMGFVYVPLLLHYIGESQYGLYQLVGSLIAYFSIMDFGLTVSVTRFYSKYKALKEAKNMANILAIALRGYLKVTAFIIFIGLVCYNFLDLIFSYSMTLTEIEDAKNIFLLLLLNIAITLSTMIFRAVINSYERFVFLKGLETLQLILQPILVILVLQKYPTAFSVALVQTSLNILLVFLRIYYCFAKLHIRIHLYAYDKKVIKEFRRLSSNVFIESIVDQIFWKTNQIILGIIKGTLSVAVYSIASLIYMNYMALSTAISGVYLPYVTELINKDKNMRKVSELFIQIGRWQYYLLAFALSGFIIFGRRFIIIWAGPNFTEAYWITLIIIIPFTIDLIQNIGLSILQAMNMYAFRARMYCAIGIINLCLAIPLGYKFGGIGCAAATGFTMFLGNGLAMNWYYSKVIKLDITSFWHQIGKISLVVIGCLIPGYLINRYVYPDGGIIVFSLKIIGYTIVYALAIYLLAMNPVERDKIKQIFGKI